MSRVGSGTAAVFVKLRLLIVLAWIAAVVWVVIALPPLSGNSSGTLGSLLPSGSPAVRAEQISAHRFALPLLSRTIVVVRNPKGLSVARQTSLATLARRLSLHQVPAFRGQIAGALPLLDTIGVPPFARHPGTTALLYLYFRPSVASSARVAAAHRLVSTEIGHRPGEYEGITGEEPATVAQENLITSRLFWVALATILVAAIAVGVRFRALPAALLTVAAVISAYLVADRVVAYLARMSGVTVPSQAEPVLIVLVFGVATDYSVFFLSRFRALLREGLDRRAAGRRTVREITPIVFTAGITVAAATAALLVATPAFIRGFGPALAIAVLMAMIVALTLVPAVLSIGGRWLFWPGIARPAPTQGSSGAPGEALQAQPPAPRSGRLLGRLTGARLAGRHPVIAALVSLAVVIAAATGLRQLAISNEMILDLPASAEVHRAYDVAREGFAPGVLAPVVVVVTGQNVGTQAAGLRRLQAELGRRPDVAQVLGPQQSLARFGVRESVWRTGDTARYVLFLGSDPLAAHAIANVHALQHALPRLLRAAGLANAHGLIAGDTALSADIVDATIGDLERVVPVMLGAIFIVIAIFLRALVAPIYLVLTSVLAAAAALGLTAYAMQGLAGYGQTAYYALLTVAVMLIALGSDYNVFLVGRLWQQARGGALADTVVTAGSRASRSIATAAIVLALSFVLLAIVPLRPFREIAFGMAVGLMIDAFVVRALLVPALVVLVGRRSAWPGSGLRSVPALGAAEEPAQAPAP
ncbi:MAG: MMPL family transporter [Solirubrobacteraceae bacterium]